MYPHQSGSVLLIKLEDWDWVVVPSMVPTVLIVLAPPMSFHPMVAITLYLVMFTNGVIVALKVLTFDDTCRRTAEEDHPDLERKGF